MTKVQALLTGVLRGELDVGELTQLGIQIEGEPGRLRVSAPPLEVTEEFPLRDLAQGLLVHWARGTKLQEWASVVLAVGEFQFIEAETADEETLIDALWQASAGEPISETALSLARAMTDRGMDAG